MSTKRMTGFTREYLPHISDYLQVRTKCMIGFTCEYLPLISYYLQVQKSKTEVTHEYLQLVSEHSQAVCSSSSMNSTNKLSSKFIEA